LDCPLSGFRRLLLNALMDEPSVTQRLAGSRRVDLDCRLLSLVLCVRAGCWSRVSAALAVRSPSSNSQACANLIAACDCSG
jgi:hypothetical protein